MRSRLIWVAIIGLALVLPGVVWADEFTSTNFKAKDPIIAPGGSGFSSSAGFKLYGSIGEVAIGTTTSASFGNKAGFLSFPVVTTPILSATAGNGQVDLSWTVASGFLGWVVSGYNYGRATISGGPYSYTSAGSTTAATASSLTNGTTYYFVVRPEDAFGNSLATSSEVTATPSAGGGVTPPAAPPAGGGTHQISGGGTARISGLAIPGSIIVALVDNQVVARVVVDASGRFLLPLSLTAVGVNHLTLINQTAAGAPLGTIPLELIGVIGQPAQATGVFFAPVVRFNRLEVKQGEQITVSGTTVPNALILLLINSGRQLLGHTQADARGNYRYILDTRELEPGEHELQALAMADGLTSVISPVIRFTVLPRGAALPPKAVVATGTRPFPGLLAPLFGPIYQAWRAVRVSPSLRYSLLLLVLIIILVFWWRHFYGRPPTV